MIRHVTLWSNGQVMVHGDDGQQVPAYQGRLCDVIDRILLDAPLDCGFRIGSKVPGIDAVVLPMTRAQFALCCP